MIASKLYSLVQYETRLALLPDEEEKLLTVLKHFAGRKDNLKYGLLDFCENLISTLEQAPKVTK